MKKFGLSFLILSLPLIVGLFPYSGANGALRVNNNSVMRIKSGYNTSVDNISAPVSTEPQPARTTTNTNSSVGVGASAEELRACNSIYPNGFFDWVRPTAGRHRGGPATCAALVELRAYGGAGTEYTVLATSYLAAGDSMTCNVDEFSSLTSDGANFTYPLDAEPTIEDVSAAMAQENKQNAGWKILGAALVGGIGGNLIGNDPNKDTAALGTSKDKLTKTAIGAAGAAALMTASTQVNNYKAGSIILSTGMNAAAGAVAGNLLGNGDDVVKIGPCKIKTGEGDAATTSDSKCIYGSVAITNNKNYDVQTKRAVFYNCAASGDIPRVLECPIDSKSAQPPYNNCKPAPSLVNIKLTSATATCTSSNTECCNDVSGSTEKFKASTDNNGKTVKYKVETDNNGGKIYQIVEAQEAGLHKPGFIEFKENKAFGYKDWEELKKKLGDNVTIYDSTGAEFKNDDKAVTLSDFHPAWQGADDSDDIDLGNKARAKSTLVGAGAGAGLGALSGAAGAESEIQERLIAAQTEYRNSLLNVLCFTGGRVLGHYNEIIVLPEMKIKTPNAE